MKTSESILKIAPKILEAQRNIGVAVKGAKNPFFDSDYANLLTVINAVKTPLNDAGISYLQAVGTAENGEAMVETVLLHESGEFVSTETPVLCKKPNDPQAMGSGITYAKRYALQAMLGLPTDEDDGNAASKNGSTKPKPKLPDAKLGYLKQDAVTKWLMKFPNSSEAIAAMEHKYHLTNEGHAYVTSLFEGQEQ